MAIGRPKLRVLLSEEEGLQLKAVASSRGLPHALATQARLVLMAAEGASNRSISERLGLSPQSVCKWCQRYPQQGLAGLRDELRP